MSAHMPPGGLGDSLYEPITACIHGRQFGYTGDM